MATPRFAWGIDIGNRALKAVKLVPSADGLVIDDFDVVEHETVLSASGDNRDSLVQTALATFVARHPGIEKGQVGVSVNGQRTFAKFIKLPPVEKSKVPEIVRFEAIQQIPFPLDDVEWSYQLFQDPEQPDIEVGIFAMRKELVNGHIKFFTDANLNVQVVQMSPLSVYNAMFYDSRIKGTTMIVDLGAENTDLIIAEGEGVWLRSIPIGGNNFTEALTKSFKVDFDKAEELKRNATTSRYSRQIVQAMRPIFADLVSEIQRSMGFYNSSHKDSRIGQVIALGSTFRLPGLQRYLEQNLTLKVAKLDRLGTGSMEDPKLAGLFSENLLSAAGAYGLALQVMGQGKIGSSLLPERIRREKMWREKNKWFAAAAALFVVGAGVAYGSYYASAGGLDTADNATLRDQIIGLEHTAGKLNTDWADVEGGGAPDRQRVANVKLLADPRGVWPQVNDLLYSTLPQFKVGGPPDGVTAEFAAGKLAAVKAVPRGDRKQIIISAYKSKYTTNLAADLALPDLSSLQDTAVDVVPSAAGSMDEGGVMQAVAASAGGDTDTAGGTAAAAVATKRGYVVTLKCSTPNAAPGAEAVVKYLADLQASPPTADRPWKVSRTAIVRRLRVGDDPVRMREMAAAYAAAHKPALTADGTTPGMAGAAAEPGFQPGREPGVGPVAAGGIPDEAYFDPALGEDVRNDTEAVVVLLIELDAAAPPPPAAPVAGKAVAAAN